jgi:hypothetical protein
MRDTFLLLWVGFLVIGVIGSIASSMRKQIAQQQSAQRPPRRVIPSSVETPIPPQWQPPPGQLPEWVQRLTAQAEPPAPRAAPQAAAPRPAPPRKKVVAPPPSAVEPAPELPVERRHGRRFFDSRKAIVQAVIAAEVLGKPRALRDEYF